MTHTKSTPQSASSPTFAAVIPPITQWEVGLGAESPGQLGTGHRLFGLGGRTEDWPGRDVSRTLGLRPAHRCDRGGGHADDRCGPQQLPGPRHRHVLLTDVHPRGSGRARDLRPVVNQHRHAERIGQRHQLAGQRHHRTRAQRLARSCTSATPPSSAARTAYDPGA